MNREADAFDYYMKAIRTNKYEKDIFQSMFLLLRTMPENETIAFLNSLYDISNEEDMRFLVSQVAGCGIKKIVLYYADKWNNMFGHEDDVLIYAFLALDQYQNAWEIAKLYLKENQAFYASPASAVLILGRLYPEAYFIRKAAGEDCYKLVKCFEKGTKYSGSTKTYLSVLSILIKHADQDLVDSYLRTGSPDDTELTNGIANIYLKDYKYDQAAHYYGLLANSQATGEREAKAAFQAGYCYYKLKRYEDSIHWFEKAMKHGYLENDIVEFLNWIGNQTPDDGLKRKAKELGASIKAE
jgi:tetratricopeptide (TPR) repeat protein